MANDFGIEFWIDDFIDKAMKGLGSGIKIPYLVKGREFPEAIKSFPFGIIYPDNVDMEYPATGPDRDEWNGDLEIYLAANTSKRNKPELLKWFGKIRAFFKANRYINDHVTISLRRNPSIEESLIDYGGVVHQCIVAHWTARERDS